MGYKEGDFPIGEIILQEVMSLHMNPYVNKYINTRVNND